MQKTRCGYLFLIELGFKHKSCTQTQGKWSFRCTLSPTMQKTRCGYLFLIELGFKLKRFFALPDSNTSPRVAISVLGHVVVSQTGIVQVLYATATVEYFRGLSYGNMHGAITIQLWQHACNRQPCERQADRLAKLMQCATYPQHARQIATHPRHADNLRDVDASLRIPTCNTHAAWSIGACARAFLAGISPPFFSSRHEVVKHGPVEACRPLDQRCLGAHPCSISGNSSHLHYYYYYYYYYCYYDYYYDYYYYDYDYYYYYYYYYYPPPRSLPSSPSCQSLTLSALSLGSESTMIKPTSSPLAPLPPPSAIN